MRESASGKLEVWIFSSVKSSPSFPGVFVTLFLLFFVWLIRWVSHMFHKKKLFFEKWDFSSWLRNSRTFFAYLPRFEFSLTTYEFWTAFDATTSVFPQNHIEKGIFDISRQNTFGFVDLLLSRIFLKKMCHKQDEGHEYFGTMTSRICFSRIYFLFFPFLRFRIKCPWHGRVFFRNKPIAHINDDDLPFRKQWPIFLFFRKINV